jgi:hypothetical protein
LNSSNPNFKGYFFVRIDKKDDIRERISTVLTAIMFEHLNCNRFVTQKLQFLTLTIPTLPIKELHNK